MDDLISRQQAVEAVEKRIRQIGYGNNPLVLSIRQAIRDLPTAQPEVTEKSEDEEMQEVANKDAFYLESLND